jgi:hypothetical protein
MRRHCTHLMVKRFERGASALSLNRVIKSESAWAYASFPEDGRGVAADDGVPGVFIVVVAVLARIRQVASQEIECGYLRYR